ncbi:hypothetical protein G6F23_015576 [Rhizopus arrhizus]|nr:hypothetical protein G6F23_015576 [Rhizopus arrhizus]
MLWLEVEGKLRELSGNRRSLDDFARAFFGVGNGDWDVNPYTFDDVVATLNGIAPYDWATFLRGRLDGHGPLTGGLALAGKARQGRIAGLLARGDRARQRHGG